MKKLVGVLLAAYLVLGASFATAAITGPVYPPPGGVTDPWTGNAGRTGGLGIQLTNFNLNQSGDLYWGPVLNLYGGDNYSFGLDGGTHPLTLSVADSNLPGGVAVHLGMSSIRLQDANNVLHTSAATPIRATLAATTLANAPLSLLDATSISGLSGHHEVVRLVNGNFKVNIRFEAFWSNTLWPSGSPIPADKNPLPANGWYPFLDLYDNLLPTPSGQAHTNLGDGYWYTPAILVPGDFDSDGDVDGADFVSWQTNFPKATGATLTQGDADSDGDVDGADFVVWQTHFPYTPGAATASVPEPAALLLALFSVPMLAYAARRVGKLY